ncbi:MAG: bifunctional hydroxymethylpyrimidine kinase/phosphomethylpyrimidine kinase [Desulfopila sp.]
MKRYTKALTIAGSDSGGGAGIQADLKTFAACGCYGMSAITAITAQNTCGVTDIHAIPPATIASQIRAVLEDIGADAIKIGMLHSSEVITAVAAILKEFSCDQIVVDPVMVATSGARLIEEEAISTLRHTLLPLASLITPNIPEAEILTGNTISCRSDMSTAARQLAHEYGTSVLLKGGHLKGATVVDIYLNNEHSKEREFSNATIVTKNSHGTGCTLSSAITAFRARGASYGQAIDSAETYLHHAIAAGAAYSIGKGHGPVDHFHPFRHSPA